ncbi:MAG: hypothetical protein Q9225_003093 [Loekoesia sp. 1 TL-2023]
MPFLDEDEAVVVEDGAGLRQANGDTNIDDVVTQLQEQVELIYDHVVVFEDHRVTVETLMTQHGLNRISQPLANRDGPVPRDPAVNASANGVELDGAIQAAVTEQYQPPIRPYYTTTAIVDNLVTRVNSLVDQLNGISAHFNQISTHQGNIVNQIDHLRAFFNGRYIGDSAQLQDLRAEYRVLTNRCNNLEVEIARLQHEGLPDNQHLLQAHNQNTPQFQSLSPPVQTLTTATFSAPQTAQTYIQQHQSITMSANMEGKKPESTHPTTDTAAMESGKASGKVISKQYYSRDKLISLLDPTASFDPQAQDFTPHDPFAHIPRDQIAEEMTAAFYAVTKSMKFKTLEDSIYNPNRRPTPASKPAPTLSDEELARRFRERSEGAGIKISGPHALDNAGTLTRSQIDEAAYGSLDLFEKAIASPKEDQEKEAPAAPGTAVKEPEKEEQEQEKPAKLAEKSDLTTDFLKVFHARYMKPKASNSGKLTLFIPPANIGDLDVFNELLQRAVTSIPRVREERGWEEVAGENGRQCWRLRGVR